MKRAPFSDSDLKLSAKFDARKKRRIMGEMDIEGLLDISASMKGDLESGSAAGAVRMEGLSVNSREKLLSLKNLNLNFPFRYGFRKKPAGESLLTVRKNQIIENPHFQDKPNFTIASISARHPARKISVEYLKDFQSYIAFKDNLFEISGLRAYILDGSLYGRRILFSIADLNTHNMEYLLELDATNIDIDRLDRPDLKEKTRRAELSFNANIAGRDLDIGRQLNMDGYVNIHKIGTDFANSLMKGLSEKKGKSILGIAQPVLDNSMTIREFNFDILNGLIYSKVSLNRRLLGNLFRIKDDTIEFERIPIQEYLRKVRKGESNEIN
jgi:hypothetical protein